MMSTKYDANMKKIERYRKGGHGEKEKVQKPVCIMEYNQYMSGIDRLDQMINFYPFTWKTLKWYKKLFFYLLEITLPNAYIIHKFKTDNGAKTILDFHMIIIK